MRLIDISTVKFPNTFVKVDDVDFEVLSAHKWYPLPVRSILYAVRRPTVSGHRPLVLMHREITQPPKHLTVDHIDGDGLNNQRSNLRNCTRSQNRRNSRKRTNSTTSQYKGVHWSTRDQIWHASIKIDGVSKLIGKFECEACAAVAYDYAALKAYGEFSRPNFLQVGARG